jgi:hypothetical protein
MFLARPSKKSDPDGAGAVVAGGVVDGAVVVVFVDRVVVVVGVDVVVVGVVVVVVGAGAGGGATVAVRAETACVEPLLFEAVTRMRSA